MKFFHLFQVPYLRLFCLLVSVVVALAMGFVLLDVAQAVEFVGRWGYWFVALPFALLCLECAKYLLRSYEAWSRTDGAQAYPFFSLGRRLLASYALPAFFVLLVAGVLLASRPIAFKVGMDELVLAATAQQMHLEKQAYAVAQAYEIEGVRYPSGQIVDKRPLFFPFLISLLHDLSGYRTSQGFYLNALILVGFLLLIYNIGSRLCAPYGGYLGVVLVATVPLVVVNATSGGFDLLNIFMILLLGGRLDAYVREADALRLNLLLLVTVLLAQTRYESVLFVVPVALTIFYVWVREKEIRITRTMICVPLMLIVFALQRRIMNEFETFWQLPEGLEQAFGAKFLGENLHIALNFFIHSNSVYPNSLLLSAGCILSLGVLAYCIFKGRYASCVAGLHLMTWLGVIVVVVSNFMLLMAYHWGRIDDPVAARLVLPMLLVECLLVLWALGVLRPSRRGQMALGVLMCAYFFCFSRPLYARADFFASNPHGRICQHLLEICQTLEGRERSLVLSDIGFVPSLTGTSSVMLRTALRQYDRVDLQMRLRSFDAVYLAYRYNRGANAGSVGDAALDEIQRRVELRFEVEVLEEIEINEWIGLRFARVKRVRIGADEMLDIDVPGIAMGVDNALFEQERVASAFVETLPK